jgi:S1-C subfamily serine protease
MSEDVDILERAPYPQVVRIYANTLYPDYDCPWQAQAPESSTGSGVIVGETFILTGAHVVANATFLQVQKQGDPDKAVAKVRSICHDADLALLEVEDPSFTEGVEPAAIGDLPDFSDRVAVVGFPIGGEEMSVTEGVVSRLELQTYDHSQRRLLAITIDAAINAGNSGGPVFQDDIDGERVVGIAFQKLGDGENIGEVVPGTLIVRFLQQAMNNPRVDIPGFGVRDQGLESPSLRRHLKMSAEQSGVLIRRVSWGTSADGVVEPGDVLLSIAGAKIANNGTIRYRGRFRTHYRVFLGDHAIGDEVDVRLLRGGEVIERKMTLKPTRYLVPRSQYDVLPTFMVWGGLVFQRLTRDFLATWEEWDSRAPTGLLAAYEHGLPTEARPELVVLSRVLADKLTVGMEPAECELIEAVDDVPVKNLAHLASLLDQADGTIQLTTTSGVCVVLDAAEVGAAHGRILERYKIARERSDDLTPA